MAGSAGPDAPTPSDAAIAAAAQGAGDDAGASAVEGGGLAEVVRWLRREKDTAECKLELVRAEAARHKAAAEHAAREVRGEGGGGG